MIEWDWDPMKDYKNSHKPLQPEWFDCECSDRHHAIRIVYDPNEGDAFFEFRVNNYQSFFQRLRAAWKYIFNLDNRDASYDTMIIRKVDAQRMINILQRITK